MWPFQSEWVNPSEVQNRRSAPAHREGKIVTGKLRMQVQVHNKNNCLTDKKLGYDGEDERSLMSAFFAGKYFSQNDGRFAVVTQAATTS